MFCGWTRIHLLPAGPLYQLKDPLCRAFLKEFEMRQMFVGLFVANLVFFLCSAANAEKLDLKDKPFAKKVAERLSQLAIGNEGVCEFQQLHFDSETKEIYGKVKFRVSHNWGTVKWKDYFSIPPVNNEKEIGVSAEAFGDFLYNMETGSVGAGLELPLGDRSVTVLGKKYSWDFGKIKVSAEQISRALEGELFALADSIPTFGVISRKGSNDYQSVRDQIEQKYGGSDFVYFARKDPFVDAVRPSKGLEYVTSMVVTLGASSTQIMRSVSNLALGELNMVRDWLADRGIAEASDVAKSILEGEAVQIPDYYLAVNWIPIEYRSRVYVGNGSQQVGPVIRESHGAFYIVLKRKNPGDSTKTDSDGFDRGPIPGNQHANQVEPGEIDWNQQRPNRQGYPLGQLARSANDVYEIDVENRSKLSVHVIITRGFPTHGAAHPTLGPGQTHHTHAGGASERIVGVWECNTGRLLTFASVYIDRDMDITVLQSPVTDYFSISFTSED